MDAKPHSQVGADRPGELRPEAVLGRIQPNPKLKLLKQVREVMRHHVTETPVSGIVELVERFATRQFWGHGVDRSGKFNHERHETHEKGKAVEAIKS
jgi:hypothetical protein